MTTLLTETADYNEPGSWERMSRGWPEIREDAAYAMFVFANCAPTGPYGSYVFMGDRDAAKESCLRVHADHIVRLREDFVAAGSPEAAESIRRRGSARRAHKWW